MNLQKGQRTKISALNIGQHFNVDVEVNSNMIIDVSCFCLDSNEKLSDDRYMIFYGQLNSPAREITYLTTNNNHIFKIDLSVLPSSIDKIVFTATIDGDGDMSKINNIITKIGNNSFTLSAADFTKEKAIMLIEMYKKDNEWRLACNGQGFFGGLSALLAHFGGEEVKDTPTQNNSNPPKTKNEVFLEKRVNLEKKIEKVAPSLVSLTKKATVSLEKRGLGKHKAKVALCLDISVSMTNLYKNGTMQNFVEKILALACRLDDDGSIEVFLFGNEGKQVRPITIDDFSRYTDKIIKENPLQYGTQYHKAIELIRKHYIKSAPYTFDRVEKVKEEEPIYVLFFTDGQTSNRSSCTRALRAASYEPIFWQFIGVGDDSFEYLQKLDDLDGRFVDNADFFHCHNINKLSDEELYDQITKEYPKWLQIIKQKGMINE